MYSKAIIFLCAAVIASASQVYQHDVPSYNVHTLPAATSHQRINIDTSSAPIITRTVAAPVSYETSAIAYAAPAVESHQYISKPAVSSQSVNLHSYNPTPIVSRTYSHVAYSAPAVVTHSAPAVSYAAAAPVDYAAAAPVAYVTSAPVVYKAAAPAAFVGSHDAYSSYASSHSPASAVSHVSYSGLGASYKW